MPGDVTAFTSTNPEKSLWHQNVKRCAGYTMERKTIDLLNPMWGQTQSFTTDLRGYHLLAAASLRIQLEPLNATWSNGGSLSRNNPINPRTQKSVRPWECVRYCNGVLMAAVNSIEYKSQNVTIEKLSGTSWFMMSETAGGIGSSENPDLGTSDNLNLRSQWARQQKYLMGEIMFDTRMSRPERAFNLAQNSSLNWILDLKERSWLVNVDSDWAEPPTTEATSDGDKTSAEITGFHIDETTLNVSNNDTLNVSLILDLVTLNPEEIPRLIGTPEKPYQQVRFSVNEHVHWVDPEVESFVQFRVQPNFREVLWAVRTTALVDAPLWRGRPLFRNGLVFRPTGQTREMQQPYHGGNQWLNFSGFHTGGESFLKCKVSKNSTVIFDDVSTYYRIALKQFHDNRTDHYLYSYSVTPTPDSLEMCGSERHVLDFYIDFDPKYFPFPVEVFVWEKYDNVVSIRNNDVTMAVQIEV